MSVTLSDQGEEAVNELRRMFGFRSLGKTVNAALITVCRAVRGLPDPAPEEPDAESRHEEIRQMFAGYSGGERRAREDARRRKEGWRRHGKE